jgi:hypothetical protein
MVALRACLEAVQILGDGRAAPRRKLNLEVQGTTSLGAAANVLIHNLSTTGLLIETSADLTVGETFEMEIPHAGATPAFVIWSSGSLFGCEFAAPVRNAAISAALLRTPAERSNAAPVADTHPHQENDGRVSDDDALRHRAKLPIRTRVSIIVGSSLVLWALIIWAIAPIV